MRFSLRTLILTTVAIPPTIAAIWWYPWAGLTARAFVVLLTLTILAQPTHEDW